MALNGSLSRQWITLSPGCMSEAKCSRCLGKGEDTLRQNLTMQVCLPLFSCVVSPWVPPVEVVTSMRRITMRQGWNPTMPTPSWTSDSWMVLMKVTGLCDALKWVYPYIVPIPFIVLKSFTDYSGTPLKGHP